MALITHSEASLLFDPGYSTFLQPFYKTRQTLLPKDGLQGLFSWRRGHRDIRLVSEHWESGLSCRCLPFSPQTSQIYIFPSILQVQFAINDSHQVLRARDKAQELMLLNIFQSRKENRKKRSNKAALKDIRGLWKHRCNFPWDFKSLVTESTGLPGVSLTNLRFGIIK